MHSTEEMLDFIKEKLEAASPAEIESVYWLIQMEFES